MAQWAMYQELHGVDAVQVCKHGAALRLHAEVGLGAVLDQSAVAWRDTMQSTSIVIKPPVRGHSPPILAHQGGPPIE